MKPASVEFLAELRERARWYGNSGDWPAVQDFVRELHCEAGVPVPDDFSHPYQDDVETYDPMWGI